MAMFLQAVDNKTLVVGSKADLPSMWSDEHAVEVSVATGAGLAELRRRIVSGLDSELLTDRPEMTNVRHIALVEHAATALSRVHEALSAGVFLPEELVLVDLQEARGALEEVTGRRTSDDLLAHIFSRFCIGK
jgi:tRNA modification GTPase